MAAGIARHLRYRQPVLGGELPHLGRFNSLAVEPWACSFDSEFFLASPPRVAVRSPSVVLCSAYGLQVARADAARPGFATGEVIQLLTLPVAAHEQAPRYAVG